MYQFQESFFVLVLILKRSIKEIDLRVCHGIRFNEGFNMKDRIGGMEGLGLAAILLVIRGRCLGYRRRMNRGCIFGQVGLILGNTLKKFRDIHLHFYLSKD